jgi:hypothetical protein
VLCPGTSGDGIGLPGCSHRNITNPPDGRQGAGIAVQVHPVRHYPRLANQRLGLLVNFNAALIKDGITRIVTGLEEESHAKSQGSQEHQ